MSVGIFADVYYIYHILRRRFLSPVRACALEAAFLETWAYGAIKQYELLVSRTMFICRYLVWCARYLYKSINSENLGLYLKWNFRPFPVELGCSFYLQWTFRAEIYKVLVAIGNFFFPKISQILYKSTNSENLGLN